MNKDVKQLVSIILPVFNEIKTINTLFTQVLQYTNNNFNFEIIIVESNSIDGTKEYFLNLDINKKMMKFNKNINIVYQNQPKGKGNAVREGLEKASGDIILIQDADLEYNINSYDILLNQFIIAPDLDLVIGKRSAMRKFGNLGIRSFYMNLGHHFFHSLFRIIYQVDIQDPTTMFKIFKKESIKGISFESNRFDFDWELICKLCRKKISYKEIEVPYKSRGFEEGKKVGMFIDPLVWLYKIIKYRIVKI